MIMAAHGSTALQEAVTATRPARIPLVKPEKSYLTFKFCPETLFLITNVHTPAAAGDKIVFTIAI